jgi:hypothetical protein
MSAPYADDGASRDYTDEEIDILARAANEQDSGPSYESSGDAADRDRDREMLREDLRADREEASWARWERRTYR